MMMERHHSRVLHRPPRIFSQTWSFGSPKPEKRLDGVVGSDDETEPETKKPSSNKAYKSNIPKVKKLNLDMSKLDTSDD